MGYSLTIPLKTKDQKIKIDTWLKENFKPITVVAPNFAQADYCTHSVDPVYAPSNVPVVGFETTGYGLERVYYSAAIRLMAMILVEPRDKADFPDEGWLVEGDAEVVPLYFHDTEVIPVLEDTIWKKTVIRFQPAWHTSVSNELGLTASDAESLAMVADDDDFPEAWEQVERSLREFKSGLIELKSSL